MRDKAGEKIDLLSVLANLNENECADIVAFATNLDKVSVPMGNYVLVFIPLSIELYTAMIGAWSISAVLYL